MEHTDTVLPTNSNLKCHVCGGSEFEEREGFYYCQECGTKQEQVRLVEVDQEDAFNQEKFKTKKQKIAVLKTEKHQLTSWECYNYILRGFVEDLLSYGAKEELKLMALQVWAAYLRRMEVAFFNRKQSDLPKLGIKYLQNDAKIIYNHSKESRKTRKRRRSEDASFTSGGESSVRDWRKSKRRLDESNYSLTSATSGGSAFSSSTSANSNRAIKIGFNVRARSYYKRKMPIKHLEKHAADAEGNLKCHKQPNAPEINRTDYNLMLVNTKQIYAILAIALNLIDDEIQLSDLVRFIHEGHIGTTNVLQYFPENIANNGKEMLKKINFYKCPDKYSDKALRDHVSTICKNIGIQRPKKPDIIKLIRRYAKELCLPTGIAVYIERLVNLLPPQFEVRTIGYYPGFEARAMAYVIFTLKLLFGLDGDREHRMSHSAQKLNTKIEELNRQKGEKQPLLFVWKEWLEYIEMRKVIVSQFNSSFCEQFKQCQSTSQFLEQMTEEMRISEDRENLFNDTNDNIHANQKLINFRSLFERFQETYKIVENDKRPVQIIEFKPSFTPALSYMKIIVLNCNNKTGESNNFEIPDFMLTDHAQRNINSYLQVSPLIDYFKRHQLQLNVHTLVANKNKSHVGIFRAPRAPSRARMKVEKACFNITEEEWAEMIISDAPQRTDGLEFRTDLRSYMDSYYVKQQRDLKKQEFFNPNMIYDLTQILDDIDEKGDNENIPDRNLTNLSNLNENPKNNYDLQSMHSFEIFSENNMKPIDNQAFLTKPRRNLEKIDLFEGISDEECVLNKDANDDGVENKPDDFVTSSQEIQTLSAELTPKTSAIFEEFIKVEPVSPNNSAANASLGKGNKSKRKENSTKGNNNLKFNISNMDCWMMFGNF